MFQVKKPFLLLEILYCEQNKIASKRFIKKFHQLTEEKYIVNWLTKKLKSFFPLKDCNLHQSSIHYKGICSYGVTNIGETICNVEERCQKIILLTINQNRQNILMNMKDTPFRGVFLLLLQKIAEHVQS